MASRFHDYCDPTMDMAVRDLSAESVLIEILSRIDDQRERVYILAHVGLDIPISTLARELKVDRRELAARVGAILARLQIDGDLAAILGEVRNAGRNDRYQALAFHLQLQDWFCSHCGEFMVQSRVGRPRRTCSDSCRRRLHQAHGRSWKDDHHSASKFEKNSKMSMKPERSFEGSKLEAIMGPYQAGVQNGVLTKAQFTAWAQSDVRFRDRALLLLGLTCPVPLTSSDLAMLDVDDFASKPTGLEIRLYRRSEQPTRYVLMPTKADQELCAVKAVLGWKGQVIRAGRTLGPLFLRLDSRGRLVRANKRLAASEIVTVIEGAVRRADFRDVPKLLPHDSLPEFLAASRAPTVPVIPERLIPVLLGQNSHYSKRE